MQELHFIITTKYCMFRIIFLNEKSKAMETSQIKILSLFFSLSMHFLRIVDIIVSINAIQLNLWWSIIIFYINVHDEFIYKNSNQNSRRANITYRCIILWWNTLVPFLFLIISVLLWNVLQNILEYRISIYNIFFIISYPVFS